MRLIATLTAVLLAGLGVVWTAPGPAGAASAHTVSISGYAFQPASLTVRAGDTVTWTNHDQAPHDVTTTSAPMAIHGSTMTKGQSWSYTFTAPGTYAYICSIHPDMKAKVVVLAAPTSKAAPARTAPAAARPPTMARPTTASRSLSRHPTGAHTAAAASSAPVVPAPVVAASAVPVAAAPAPSGPSERPLRPLLIVAGIVAAVATLSLLLLAARPEPPRSPSAT